ncbi:uncharacterized protein LOC119942291 [Tachyglossus aculeatus]|uniref:uncharacterized protein LOC119942291 n=1 Tax=Tachyglossus aculeatus TaxID=9261 RepID=UPI0018F60864|nr:uncharacterized protein LOC119942291 [Tachyglossus aculeatus]
MEPEAIILISDEDDDDDDDEEEEEAAGPGGSVLLLTEPLEDSVLEEEKSEEIVDEESGLVLTFCKKGSVMPHARYDCMTNLFERAECETCIPLERNAETCGQCYCYICDKPASECRSWTTPALCHCNAHNKSKYWKGQRDFTLAGVLATFNLELSEIDQDLRRGGELLIQFVQDLSVEYTKYLGGERLALGRQDCFCHPKRKAGQCSSCRWIETEMVYRYSSVFQKVSSFIGQAEEESPKTAAVMLLGAIKEISVHKDPARNWQNLGPTESLKIAVPALMDRMTRVLQRLLVLSDFPKSLCEKFIQFFQSVILPPYCFAFTNCLNVAPWDHRLLTTVLKGQNITGKQKKNGKKETLWEVLPVIQARVEKMEHGDQFKELVRYLKAVKSDDTLGLREYRDKIPFYLCKSGDFTGAAQALLLPLNNLACCTACRLAPLQFEIYLKMFRTGSVPSGKSLLDSDKWTINVGTPVKLCILIKQALRVLYSNLALYRNARCWGSLITVLGSSPILEPSGLLTTITLPEPSASFCQTVLSASCDILKELKSKANASLPSSIFYGSLTLEACFILVVQAGLQMLLTDLPWLSSLLEIMLAFGKNLWALKLFLEGISYHVPALHDVLRLVTRDLSYRKHMLLRLWETLGPEYVSELLCLFLSFQNVELQSIGIYFSHLVMENLQECPWAKSLDVSRLKALKRSHLETANQLQLNKFVSILEKL